MANLLNLIHLGITFFVPGVVWSVLLVGLLQFIREPIKDVRIPSARVVTQARSR